MNKATVLEPIQLDSKEEAIFKEKWCKIQKYLKELGMGLDVTTTFEEMLSELSMTNDEYIKAVLCSLVRPKYFCERRVCEIRVNNYMKNCLEFWRANHDIQPPLEPFGMIEYILNYVTKAQKGISIIMDQACKEACSGNMDLKASVCHIGNAFLNVVETPQEEAATLVLQIPITRMSRKVVFIPTSHPDERTFLLKDYETLKEMNPESHDIKSHNIIFQYEC